MLFVYLRPCVLLFQAWAAQTLTCPWKPWVPDWRAWRDFSSSRARRATRTHPGPPLVSS